MQERIIFVIIIITIIITKILCSIDRADKVPNEDVVNSRSMYIKQRE